MRISINIIWGVVFTALGVIELIKRYQIVYGIPLWAICFFAVAFSNFLRDPAARAKMRIFEETPEKALRTATVINAVAITVLIVSVVVEFIRN